MSERMTPEERLLRLIRRHSPRAHSEGTGPAGVVTPEKGAGLKKGQTISATARPMSGLGGIWGGQRRAALIQRGLVLVGLLNLFLLSSGLFAHRAKMQQIDKLLTEVTTASTSNPEGQVPKGGGVPSTLPQAPESYETVAQGIQGRELFRHLVAPPLSKPETASGPLPVSIQNRLKELTLLGIVSGPTLQAIIDDTASKKTYFLKEGETAADIRMVQILKGKVVVEIQGETHELAL